METWKDYDRIYNLNDLSCFNLSIVFEWSTFDNSIIFDNSEISR
jgi:hypothetical protein